MNFLSGVVLIEPINNDAGQQENYLYSNIFPILMDGLFETAQKHPDDPIIFLANWLHQHNPHKPIINEFQEGYAEPFYNEIPQETEK